MVRLFGDDGDGGLSDVGLGGIETTPATEFKTKMLIIYVIGLYSNNQKPDCFRERD
jgi:hypothetical protein